MTEFTKEEIRLCKQVAKKHRLKIEKGDWYWSNAYDNILLAMDYGFKPDEQNFNFIFKIWTISDCLEFLEEKMEGMIELWKNSGRTQNWQCPVSGEVRQWCSGKTALEACLKAVIEALK